MAKPTDVRETETESRERCSDSVAAPLLLTILRPLSFVFISPNFYCLFLSVRLFCPVLSLGSTAKARRANERTGSQITIDPSRLPPSRTECSVSEIPCSSGILATYRFVFTGEKIFVGCNGKNTPRRRPPMTPNVDDTGRSNTTMNFPFFENKHGEKVKQTRQKERGQTSGCQS